MATNVSLKGVGGRIKSYTKSPTLLALAFAAGEFVKLSTSGLLDLTFANSTDTDYIDDTEKILGRVEYKDLLYVDVPTMSVRCLTDDFRMWVPLSSAAGVRATAAVTHIGDAVGLAKLESDHATMPNVWVATTDPNGTTTGDACATIDDVNLEDNLVRISIYAVNRQVN